MKKLLILLVFISGCVTAGDKSKKYFYWHTIVYKGVSFKIAKVYYKRNETPFIKNYGVLLDGQYVNCGGDSTCQYQIDQYLIRKAKEAKEQERQGAVRKRFNKYLGRTVESDNDGEGSGSGY